MRAFVAIVFILVAVVLVVGFFNTSAQLPVAAANVTTNDITASAASASGADIPFVQGGTVLMDLEAANYKIIPSTNDHITVFYDSKRYNSGTKLISAGVKGSNANLHVQTPSGNGVTVEIAVPAKTSLYIRLTAGNLVVDGIEGSKDIDANAGNLSIDVVNAKQYGPVNASVTTGNLSAQPWSVHKGGLFRSFKTRGSGKYGLRAHVSAGNLTLTERSALQ